MSQELDLFKFLRYILDCEYISDLKIEPYNTKAKLLLKQLKLKKNIQENTKKMFS